MEAGATSVVGSCASGLHATTMERLMATPMPLPCGLVVKESFENPVGLSWGQAQAGVADRD